ncbi:MAG: hypothetical protein RLZZ628_373 [Bacteroidota bacterium]|jgi:hypothetical protein
MLFILFILFFILQNIDYQIFTPNKIIIRKAILLTICQ